jgi:hypothetical protein
VKKFIIFGSDALASPDIDSKIAVFSRS